jgi:hypothetical protein
MSKEHQEAGFDIELHDLIVGKLVYLPALNENLGNE